MAAASPPDTSSDFPNLQELLQQVSTQCADASWTDPSPVEASDDFPSLSAMAQEMQPEQSIEETMESEEMESHDEPEPVMMAPWAATAEHHEEPEPQGLTQATESIADEVHAAETWDDTDWEERGLGLLLGGAVLILLGLALACTIPAAWISAMKETGETAQEFTRLAWVRTWLCGVPAAFLVVAGVGSVQRKGWSVPLVHAGGWYVALSALLGLAVVTAGYFLIAPPSGHIEKSVALSAGKILLMLGVFGVAVPLGLIAIYQRRYLPHLCAKADPKPRWTDDVQEPMLMVMLSCWFGMLVMLMLSSLKQCSFPFFGHMLDARSGGYVIYPILLAGLFVAVRWVLARQRKGWWLALGSFTFMAVSTAVTFWQLPWNTVLTAWGLPTDSIADAQPSRLAMLVALGCYAPQLMVLLMARGCFPKPEDEELEAAVGGARNEG